MATPFKVTEFDESTYTGYLRATHQVIAADFNGDTLADLATLAYDAGNPIGILVGDGTGKFSIVNYVSSGESSYDLKAGDVNGDGKTDLLGINTNKTISIFWGDGKGSVTSYTNFDVGVPFNSIYSIDLNGDGKLDLAPVDVTYNNKNISVLLGDGTGKFSKPEAIDIQQNISDLAWADVNGDGKIDLITADEYSTNISVLLGDGTGKFGKATNFNLGATPNAIAVGDLNGDGKTDIASTNSFFGGISVILGDGKGNFGTATSFYGGISLSSIKIADFNADAKNDLVVGYLLPEFILWGDNSGKFNTYTDTLLAKKYYVDADFNGDKKTDFLANDYGKIKVAINDINSLDNIPKPIPRPAGFTVSPTSGLTTTEAGATAAFTVKLDRQPTADVAIGLISSDKREGTVSPASLKFTANNWDTPQTVTVTGVDDKVEDDDQVYTIITQPAVSADIKYDKLNPSDITLTNIASITPTPTPTPTPSGIIFSDISTHWAKIFIERLAKMKIISGFPNGTFKPDLGLTRAQYAALLAKAFELAPRRDATNFKDVAADFWAKAAIEKANRGGFLAGYPDITFRPNQNLTRAQAIVSLVNGLQLVGGNPNSLSVYSDRALIPSFATAQVATATERRMVVNYPARDRLSPARDITRGEISALIYQTLVATNRAEAINSPYIV